MFVQLVDAAGRLEALAKQVAVAKRRQAGETGALKPADVQADVAALLGDGAADLDASLAKIADACGVLFTAEATALDVFFMGWLSVFAEAENGAGAFGRLLAVLGDAEAETQRAEVLKVVLSLVSPELQGQVFPVLVKQILATKSIDTIAHAAEEFADRLGAAADLRRAVADALVAGGRPHDAYTLSLHVLRSGGGDADDAKLAVAHAIRDPKVLVLQDLAAYEPVRGLEKSDPGAFALLQVFTNGDHAALQATLSQHSDVLSKLSIDTETVTRKIRLLTLASLASNAGESREVSFADISKALAIDENEAEAWAIDGVAAGVWAVKLDAAGRVARVSNFLRRTFSESDWKAVATRLGKWEASLAASIQALDVADISSHPEKLVEKK